MAELAKMLEEAGLIENREGRYELTPRGIRKIGSNALNDLFKKLSRDRMGSHELERTGAGHERAYETKPYEFGDPFNLHIERTVRNAIQRSGRGTPVHLQPDDFEIERTEHLTKTSSVLMLDLSLSMPMRDNFLAAKKVAMALHSLISSQFPRDYLGIVGFSSVARELKPEDLPEVSWDFVYGTNMQHGFMLSRRLLARQGGTKQIIMITDGEPTAHFEPGMTEPFFSYPPVRETVDATLREVARCTREGVRINTFMLDATSYLKAFVEKLTHMNGGRAFFTTPETLGDYVLVDFVEHRTQRKGAPSLEPANPRRFRGRCALLRGMRPRRQTPSSGVLSLQRPRAAVVVAGDDAVVARLDVDAVAVDDHPGVADGRVARRRVDGDRDRVGAGWQSAEQRGTAVERLRVRAVRAVDRGLGGRTVVRLVVDLDRRRSGLRRGVHDGASAAAGRVGACRGGRRRGGGGCRFDHRRRAGTTTAVRGRRRRWCRRGSRTPRRTARAALLLLRFGA